MDAKRWSDLDTRQRFGVAVSGAIQLVLAITAWRDLAQRPAKRVNGPKGAWAAVIGINFVGPISYFIFGRKD